MVVVERKAEAELVESLLAGRAQADDAVGPLPGDPATGRNDGVQDPVAERARRVGRSPRREGERIGTPRAQVGGDHGGSSIVAGPAGGYALLYGSR